MSSSHVCPVERANGLDFKLRKLIQNPYKILSGFVSEGMTVIDIGCGPGFFSLPIAEMVGNSGQVICVDLQQGMLDIISKKIADDPISERIVLHKCEETQIGLDVKADFILSFFMLHEVPDKKRFLDEAKNMLKPNGKLLLVEPKFHVSKKVFNEEIEIAKSYGFEPMEEPKIFMSLSQILLSKN